MADITMCSGTDCSKKETCYRYTAKKGCVQSYFAVDPKEVFKDINTCEYYWKVDNA